MQGVVRGTNLEHVPLGDARTSKLVASNNARIGGCSNGPWQADPVCGPFIPLKELNGGGRQGWKQLARAMPTHTLQEVRIGEEGHLNSFAGQVQARPVDVPAVGALDHTLWSEGLLHV